jgi:hypothetical protein
LTVGSIFVKLDLDKVVDTQTEDSVVDVGVCGPPGQVADIDLVPSRRMRAGFTRGFVHQGRAWAGLVILDVGQDVVVEVGAGGSFAGFPVVAVVIATLVQGVVSASRAVVLRGELGLHVRVEVDVNAGVRHDNFPKWSFSIQH